MASAISVQQLIIGYQNRKKNHIVAKIPELELEEGKLTCLLGPNGVGKSTLIKTITGALPAMDGNVMLGEEMLHDLQGIERAKKLAIVLTDKPALGYTTVYEMIALGRNPYTNWQNNLTDSDHEAIANALVAIGMESKTETPLSELSDGNLQKVIIGRALAQDTNIIVLDEPTVHLDINNKLIIIRLLRSLCVDHGKTVLLSTHDLELAQTFADNLWVFDADKITAGLTEDLIMNGTIAKVFPSTSVNMEGEILFSINGPSEIHPYLKNAIRKAGAEAEMDGKTITVDKTGTKLSFSINGKEFNSLQQLIQSLATKS